MYDTTQLSVPKKAERIFNVFLFFYPETHRKQYGDEMRLVFTEMYQEEFGKKGKIGIGFWFSQVSDMTQSIIDQHIHEIGIKGMKKYIQQTFHINKYNVIGFIFLLPFFLMFLTDFISRIAQGDLTHYNRAVDHYLSQTPLYWTPVLYLIVIVFPILAVASNVIPLFLQRRKKVFSWVFIRKNGITLIIIFAGLGCISIIKLHDFLPCMIRGILRGGLTHFSEVFPYCQKA